MYEPKKSKKKELELKLMIERMKTDPLREK